MYLSNAKQKNGRRYLSIVHAYWDSENKKKKTKTIKSLGYLDELEKKHDNPIAYFEALAKEMTAEHNAKAKPIELPINQLEELEPGTNNVKNYGYAALSAIYHELGIDRFLNNWQRKLKAQYSLNAIFRLLVFGRAIFPGSKKSTYEKKEAIFEKADFSASDMYNGLTHLTKAKDALLKWLFEKVSSLYGRDTSTVYYDVTNYYFEIDTNDEDIMDENGKILETGFRKRGVEKNRRPDPIIQMGLLLDNNGLPISYQLFDGNTNDTLTLRPSLKKARIDYGLGKVVLVADKGVNSGDNLYYLLSGKNGYILSKSIRGASKELKQYALDPEGYQAYVPKKKKASDNADTSAFLIKSKREPREIQVTQTGGKKKPYIVHEKLVVFYSEKYAKRAKKEREAIIAKARDLINHPQKYNKATTYGAAKYVQNLKYDLDTGVVLKSKLYFDEDLVKEEEALDGYYAIVTSEMKLPAGTIVDKYHELWKIEESFKVTKSQLETRPIYLERKDRIEAHFLICFVTLLIMRILEKKTGGNYSIEQLLHSLRQSNYNHVTQNHFVLGYFDQVLQAIGEATDIEFNRKFATLETIRKNIAMTKKN